MPDTAVAPDSSVVARFSTEAGVAQDVIGQIADSFDSTDAVATAFEDAGGRWTIAIHFRDRPNATAVRALVALAAGPEAANALVFETIAAKDWVKASLEGLSPVAAGRFVVHGAHDRARVPVNAIGIEIEAALAFGTGHHGTTRGCLLALDGMVKRRTKRPCPYPPPERGRIRRMTPRLGQAPMNILDVGTGSGVLAIAAAKALRRPVLASDIDAVAVRAARANAQRNRVGAAITVVHAGGLAVRRVRECAPFSLVLANILLEPIKALAAPMAKLVASHGRIVLSGLLTVHAMPALAAYLAQGFALERRIQLGGWTTLVLRRR